MNLAAYIRVSTEGQVDAFGKDVQLDAIRRWSNLNGHVITHVYEEDAVSGKVDGGDRPALSQLIEQTEQKRFEGMVVFDATRLARRLIVQETLLALVWASGLKVFSSTAGELEQNEDDPTKILIRQILGVIAEFDHRTTVRRLSAGRVAKSAKGGFIGGTTPYGFVKIDSGKASHLVSDPIESEIVADILRKKSYGQSLRQIATELNGRGVPTKTGKQWSATQVSRIIARNENT